jgi:hypothetical protein
MTVRSVPRHAAKKVGLLGLGAVAGLLLQLVLGWSPAEGEELVIPWTVEQASPGAGDFCVETAEKSCDDFRADCRAAGGGTTSTGAAGVAIVNCIAIPPIPQ